MASETGFEQLGAIATSVLTRGQQRGSMSIAEKQTFDEDCAKYDLEIEKAKAELLKMASRIPSPGTEQDPETTAAVYWEILKTELSPLSIALVCRKALAGYVGNPSFLPTPGALVQFAKAWGNFIQCGELVKIDPRLGPPIQPQLAAPEHCRLGREYGDEQFRADEQARIGRKFQAFADEMRARNSEIAASEKQAFNRMDTPPLKLSAELLEKLGCGAPEIVAE